MKKLVKLLYDFLKLIFPVMLGVYLGLLANNWNQGLQQKKLRSQVLQNISQEIQTNLEELNTSKAYFKTLNDSTYYHLRNNIDKNPAQFSFWKGMNAPLLREASYNSAALTGIIAQLDLGLIEQLDNCYSMQRDLEDQARTYFNSMTNKIGTTDFTNRSYMILLRNYAYDLIVIEEELIEALKTTHSLIQQQLPEKK